MRCCRGASREAASRFSDRPARSARARWRSWTRIPISLRVAALAAGDNAALLAEQVARYCPDIVGMATADGADRLKTCLAEPGGRARPRSDP